MKILLKNYFLISAALSANLLAQSETLTLSEAYSLAIKNESKTRAAAFKADASAEGVSQARARLLPQIQYSYSKGKTEYESQYYRTATKEMYTYNQISLVQPLFHPDYWFGASQAYIKRDGSALEYKRQSELLGIDLAKTYFNYLKIKREEALANWQMEQYNSKYKQLDKMLSMGLSNKIDMLDAKIRFDKAKAEWLSWQKQSGVAKYALEKMIGESIDNKTLLEPEKINVKTLSSEKGEWEQKILQNNDVRLADTYLKIAQKEIDVRASEHYPKVDMRISYTKTDTQDISAHKYDKSFFIDIKIPIYQGGYTSSRVSEAKLLARAAKEDLDATTKEAKLKFEDLWSRRDLSIQSVELFREHEKASELYVESVEKAHKAGLKSVVDVLEAKAKLYSAKRDLINSTYELVSNQLELLNATGELNASKIKELENKMSI